MNFKLINLPEYDAQVFCGRDLDDDDGELVEIRAVVNNLDGDEFYQEKIFVNSAFQAKVFVAGFTGKKAAQWLDEQIESCE